MFKKIATIGFIFAVCAVGAVPVAQAQQRIDNKTVLTFSQPVEIPGHVLPAGTYTFKLLDSMSDRHIVEVFNADQKIIATVMAIPDYRLDATDKTVIKFTEVPSGSPDAIRAWFYPGNRTGHEFVYPKRRAAQLARAAKAAVPAMGDDVADINAMKSAPIVAITADEKEVPVVAAIQTTPAERTATRASSPVEVKPAVRELPKTSSSLPTVVLFGLGSLAAAFALLVFVKTAPATLT